MSYASASLLHTGGVTGSIPVPPTIKIPIKPTLSIYTKKRVECSTEQEHTVTAQTFRGKIRAVNLALFRWSEGAI